MNGEKILYWCLGISVIAILWIFIVGFAITTLEVTGIIK
jgi:hypothetical protein